MKNDERNHGDKVVNINERRKNKTMTGQNAIDNKRKNLLQTLNYVLEFFYSNGSVCPRCGHDNFSINLLETIDGWDTWYIFSHDCRSCGNRFISKNYLDFDDDIEVVYDKNGVARCARYSGLNVVSLYDKDRNKIIDWGTMIRKIRS